MLSAGDVILIDCQNLKNPHDKFAICVCPTRKWFFFINSKPNVFTPEAQVPIRSYELACLDYDSWVDTSKVISFSDSELIPAKRDKRRHKGALSNAVKLRIKKAVRIHGLLAEIYAESVRENL